MVYHLVEEMVKMLCYIFEEMVKMMCYIVVEMVKMLCYFAYSRSYDQIGYCVTLSIQEVMVKYCVSLSVLKLWSNTVKVEKGKGAGF